jgi:hypothetical protein
MLQQIFSILGAVLLSIAGGGAIVIALSSWLGKIWATRILTKESHQLDIHKQTVLKIQEDKILIYRAVIDVIADLLAKYDAIALKQKTGGFTAEEFFEFNKSRMRTYGYLAMFAPQDVMSAHDALMDYLLQVMTGAASYDWKNGVRPKVLTLINKVRNDIGIDKESISYTGVL